MKNIIKICLAGLLLLGLATTKEPDPENVYSFQSLDEIATQKGSVQPCPLPPGFMNRFTKTTGNSDQLDAIQELKQMGITNLPFGNNGSLKRVAHDDTPPVPDDSSGVLSYDFSDDIRVNNPTSYQQFQPACTKGVDGTIYVVWANLDASDNYSIYFSKSTDTGSSWTTAVRVAGPDSKPMNRPRVAVWGTGSYARVYVTYTYYYNNDENDLDILLRYSTNGGTSFSNSAAISSNSYYADLSDIVVDNSNYVYIAYTYAYWSGSSCDEDDIDIHIYLAVSYNGGSSWRSQRYIASDSRDEVLPSLAVYGNGTSSTLHFAYTFDFDNGSDDDYDVRYRRITNAGSTSPTIGSVVSISAYTTDEYVIAGGLDCDNDNNPHIVYSRNDDVYYRRSTDGGASFRYPVAISTMAHEETDACIACDGEGNPIIVWRDARRGHPDIFMSYSNDGGTTFSDHVQVNMDDGYDNQYWPSVATTKSDWTRDVAIVWWDDRWDDGDIMYNGNYQKGLRLNVTINPDYPAWDPLSISYHSFEEELTEEFSISGTYNIWFDNEYTYSPLVDRVWSGSTDYERWACEVPSSWTTVPYTYMQPPAAGGEFDLDYYHQYNIYFWPEKGNPEICDRTMPNLTLTYETFGAEVDTPTTDVRPVDDWADKNSSYTVTGWIDLDPHTRWAGVSDDTIGTITSSDTIRPTYYLQFLPHIYLVGPSEDNSVCTDIHNYLGENVGECSLWGTWTEWVDCGSVLDFSDSTELGWHAVDTTVFYPTDYFTATIRYRNEEEIIIENDFEENGTVNVDGSVVASPSINLWGPASVHSIGAVSPQTFGDTTRYYFSHWSDAGAATHDITVPEHSMTITAYFDQWFKLDMNYTGVTGGHVPTLTGDGWYIADDLAAITASTHYDSTAGVRYGFSHWSSIPEGAVFDDPTSPSTNIHMIRNYVAVANYAVQYRLIVNNPDGYGIPDPPAGDNWFDVGSEVTVSAGSPDETAHMYCDGYTGTGAVPSSGITPEVTFTIDEPSTITWSWENQPSLTIISTFGAPSPSAGVHYYDPGTYVEASVTSPFYIGSDMRMSCDGYTGSSEIGSGSTPFAGFVITTDDTIIWNWSTQYKLTINNPGGYDSPVPPVGTYWYNEGADIIAFVHSPTSGMVCIGFTGTGSVPTYAPFDSIGFTLSSPTSISWNWTPYTEVVSLTVTSDIPGVYPSGTTYYIPGTIISCTATSPYYSTTVDGKRSIASSYTGTGSAPSGSGSTTGSFAIFTNSTLDWTWENQWRLTIASNPPGMDSPDPGYGEHWYDEGTTVIGEIDETVGTMFCSGYVGTGSAVSASTNTFSFTIDTTSSVTWQWGTDAVNLTINNDHGSCSPSVGTYSYARGTTISCSCDSAIYISPTERWKCVGYEGTGGAPSGSGRSVIFTIVADGTLSWIWEHQYRFDVTNTSGYGTPEPTVGQHWYADGTVISGYIAPNPDGDYYCIGYDGMGSLPSMLGADSFEFTIHSYSSCDWNWAHASTVAQLIITSDYGHPYPPEGTYYYPIGSDVDCEMDSASIYESFDNRYLCIGALGTGSFSSTHDTIFTFEITTNTTVNWQWQHDYLLTINNPDGFGTPSPVLGTHWINEDATVTASITPIDGVMRCVGYYGTGAIDDGYSSSVTFDMTMPTIITWRWALSSDVVAIRVSSAYDACTPPVGVHYIPIGTNVHFQCDSFYSIIEEGTRARFDGFTGEGNIPVSGTDNDFEIVLTETSQINWDWQTEHYLTMLYFNCGDGVPDQYGAGWYEPGTEVEIWTQPDIIDPEDSTWFGFMRWQVLPSTTPVENTYHPLTAATVDEPCTLIALYNLAVPCTVQVDFDYDWSDIYVDGIWYEDSSEVVLWWGIGSTHDITVLDTFIDGRTRFVWDSWSDAGALEHTVGPISTAGVWTASYNMQHELILNKSPLQAFGNLYVEPDTFDLVSQVSVWVDDGETPIIGCTSPDGTTDHRYFFDSWSDAGTQYHELGAMTEPLTITATYTDEFLLNVRKVPREYYGYITYNDSTLDAAAEIIRWIPRGGSATVSVSDTDIGPDSVWFFNNWNGVVSDSIPIKEISVMDTSYILLANYNGNYFELNFRTPDTAWYLDTMNIEEWRSMTTDEALVLDNGSTVPVDYGLTVFDTTSIWNSSCSIGNNRFVLRAIFNDDGATPPAVYSYSYDCVKPFQTWATDDIFGSFGHNVMPDETQYLWLQFGTPRYSSTFETPEFIILNIQVRPRSY